MSLISLSVVRINKAPLLPEPKVIQVEALGIEYIVEDTDPENSGGSLVFIESKAGSKPLLLQCEDTLSEIKALANADMVILLDITIKESEGTFQFDLTGGSLPALINSRKISEMRDLTEINNPIEMPTVHTVVKVESLAAVAGTAGAGYLVGDVLTLVGGVGTDATATISKIKPVNTQTQANYDNSPSGEGTFAGGTGHAVGDVITLTNGTTVTVVAVSVGVVTQFTVNSSASTGHTTNGATLSQTGTTGSGIGFSLTLDTLNQAVHTIGLTTAGAYSEIPTPIGAVETTGSAAGTGAVVSVDFEVDSVVVDDGGTGLISVSISFVGGGGSGAAASGTVTGGALASVTVSAPGNNYTSIPTAVVRSTGPTRTVIKYAQVNRQRLARFQVTETKASLVTAANATTDVHVLTSYTVFGMNRPWSADYSISSTVVLNDSFVQKRITNGDTGYDKIYYNYLGLEISPRFKTYYVESE